VTYQPTVAEWENYYETPDTQVYWYDYSTGTYNQEVEPSPYTSYYYYEPTIGGFTYYEPTPIEDSFYCVA